MVEKSVVREKLLSQDVYAVRPYKVRLVNCRMRGEVAWLHGSHDAGYKRFIGLPIIMRSGALGGIKRPFSTRHYGG